MHFSDHEMKMLEVFMGNNSHQENGVMNTGVVGQQEAEGAVSFVPNAQVHKAFFTKMEVMDRT